jgi:hypothetical protein
MNSYYTMLAGISIIERPAMKDVFCLYFMAIKEYQMHLNPGRHFRMQ